MIKFNNIKSANFVVDMDDVIVFTTSLWFGKICTHRDLFEPYFKKDIIPKDYDYERYYAYPLLRSEFYFKDWLINPNISKDKIEYINNLILDILRKDPDFYSQVDPTPIVPALISMVKYKGFKVNKLYIVTRSYDENIQSKKKCIQKIFAPIIDKVEIIIVEPNEKKSDAIKDIPDVRLIIDDELSNIYDYIDNSNLNQTKIIIPRTGYNINFTKEYIDKAEEKKLDIEYYTFNI